MIIIQDLVQLVVIYNRYPKSPSKSLSPIKKRFIVKDYTKNALINNQNKDNFLQIKCDNDSDNEDNKTNYTNEENETFSTQSSNIISSNHTEKLNNNINIFQLNKSNYVNKEKNNFNNIYYQQYINNNDTKSISTVSESDEITIINENNNISSKNIKKSKPKLFIDKYKNISNAIDSWYNKNEIYTPKRYNRLKEAR